MARDLYPTGGDVGQFLTDSKLKHAGLDLGSAALLGREVVERETDRVFLAVSATREFDPPVGNNGVLDLGVDLVSLSSLTYGGTAWTAGTDYRLQPVNATVEGKPFSMIRFNRRWQSPLPFSQQGSLVITGLWGYSAKIPEDVWQAMRAAAAVTLLPAISFGLTRGLVSWSDEDTTENYGKDPLGNLAATWGAIRSGAIARYKRVAVG